MAASNRARTEQAPVPPTRERIAQTSAQLFRRQGFQATGLKQIANEARAPFGSVYHHFPGGKEELGAEVIRRAGREYAQLGPAIFGPAPDVVSGVREFFDQAGRDLAESGYEDACPIATVALEISSSSEPMRLACEQVFGEWVDGLAALFAGAGIEQRRSRELAVSMLCGLEGAFVLARAMRSTEPLTVSGATAAAEVSAALADARAQ